MAATLSLRKRKTVNKTVVPPELSRAKIIFAGKLRNSSFCHIVGVERPNFFLKTGRYWLDLGFKIGLNEKLSIFRETSENIF